MINDENSKFIKKEPPNITFKELSLIQKNILWVDFVREGSNVRKAIFVRPFNNKNALPQQLTDHRFNIQSNFHGYGGKSYKCIEFNKHFYLIWIDQYSGAIWFQIFKTNERLNDQENKYLLSIQEPSKLSKSLDINFDASFVITPKNFLYGICEIKNRDYLFSLDLKKTNQDIYILKKFDNFAGDLSSNISANHLSWIEWDTPYMPWENNSLFFAEIGLDGEIKKLKKFSNPLININKNCSFFQPYWISDNLLVCSEDSSGWWNLLFIDVIEIENIIIRKRIKKIFFEYGSPQWVSGITFFSGSFENLFCLSKNVNTWKLEHYQDLMFVQEVQLPYSSISDFHAFEEQVALKGDGSDFISALFEIDFGKKISFSSIKSKCIKYIKNEYSKPETFWFEGFENKLTHSFLYKPLVERFEKPPLLIRAHSGPTSCFDGSYNSEVQYWSSKGFFVAEVNYGGSSGFGREYRERLNYKWGLLDAHDCKALVIELFQLNLVDRDKVVIFGNSAGGLTALNSLYDGDFFKAAICKYPVVDLIDMYNNTHRFEKDYLNNLIGNYEKFLNEYKNRSPINKIPKITKPILLFHGKKDSVISYKQSLRIREKQTNNDKYSEVILFENEGHGFKNIENKKIVMRKTEEFLSKILGI